jgi:hypothetical protein
VISENLERLWLEQLLREFADICFQYNLQLQAPVFELSGATRQLGCWLSEQRIIRLSRQLITAHSWDIVLMVLKHEMAHQLCSEVFGLAGAGHGRSFHQACGMLGIPDPYCRSSGDLAAVVAAGSQDEQTAEGRRLIRRISKLLALAGSDNEHEAALAMQRATEMLHRHNLERVADDRYGGCSRCIIQTGSKQIPTYRRLICGVLRDFFYVQVVCSSLYDPAVGCSYKTIELLGRSENVPVAEHCYYFLEQQVAALWQANRHRFTGNSRTAKNSYCIGLLHGFAAQMAGQVQESSRCRQQATPEPAVAALTVSRDRMVQEFVGLHFPRLQKRAARGVRIYSQPYDEAVDTGKTIVLHRSVTEKKQGIQGVLGS